MQIVIDPDVKAVADFMDRAIPAGKRMGVANRLAEIASLLWGHHEAEDVAPLRLRDVIAPLPDHRTAAQVGEDR